tara:strand:- start:1517 stop:3163 length:1647 start_codon:yes stop_codon:yes gene_type:complete
MSIEEITNICGQFPKNFKKEIITGSNHIFQVDPNYAPINLQNFIGNSVTVNSFAECLHYVEGGFKPSIITIFELSFILLGITSLIFFVYKLYQIKFLSKLFKSIKILFVKAKKFNFVKYKNQLLFLFFLIQNYFLFDYIRTKAVRIPPFIDEYISLTSNVSFFKNFDFNAGDFIGGSYSVFLTSGPLSAIGGVIGWNISSKLIIARLSNFYWILFLQMLLSLIIVKIYKSDYKFILFMNTFFIILVPWWQGSLYMIGEFASNVIFVNAIYLFHKRRKVAMALFSLSIFFGKLLTLLPFLAFYIVSLFIEKGIKKVFSDMLFFILPLFFWLVLVSNNYETGNIFDYISDLLSVVLNHQSSGIENTSGVSEVSNWNNFEIFRVLVVPLFFIYLVLNNRDKINNTFGLISFPLLISTMSIYLWFWLLSPTKWMRYSQHFTILVILSMIYFLGFKVIDSKFDHLIIYSSISLFIDNSKIIILIFILFITYILFLQKRVEPKRILKFVIVFIIFVDISIPYFQKNTFGDLNKIIDSCNNELLSSKCLEDYENQ